MQSLAIGRAIADKGVPYPTANAAIKAILASVSEVLGRYRPAPTDGVCACALAFSTLLSSQGADAHHRSALAGFRGNPTNLPASSGPVKSRYPGFGLACQLAPASAYLRFGTTRSRAPSRKPSCSLLAGPLLAGPREPARQRRSVSLGAGETLGSNAVSVKSGLPAPVTAGSPAADLHSKPSCGRTGGLQDPVRGYVSKNSAKKIPAGSATPDMRARYRRPPRGGARTPGSAFHAQTLSFTVTRGHSQGASLGGRGVQPGSARPLPGAGRYRPATAADCEPPPVAGQSGCARHAPSGCCDMSSW
jgi:hypothetical protein